MGTRKKPKPSELTAARKALDRWRATRTQRAIPEPLWETAVSLAQVHGVHRTSRELRLNYERLRQRVSLTSVAAPPRLGASPFVEVVPEKLALPSPAAADGECVIELENARGDRARVQTRGVPDLAALAASLWGSATR